MIKYIQYVYKPQAINSPNVARDFVMQMTQMFHLALLKMIYKGQRFGVNISKW